jgi:SAM-dependent methyltransferase
MVQIAGEKAAALGLKNIDTVVCDVSELPFADHTFDAVSCRFGFMFFPDMQMAAKEILRVLKPGGRFATSVWNIPEKNFWVTVTMSTINKNMELPPNPSGAPGMFRCSKPGMMTDLFQEAGFKNVAASEVGGQLQAGTAETYWSFMTEVGAPIVAALSKADEAMKEKIKNEVFGLLQQKYGTEKVIIDSSAWVISGEK